MKTHDLKIFPHFFSEIKSGSRKWEFRYNDRGYKAGDLLILNEWDGKKYTGRKIKCIIESVFNISEFGLQEGWVILSLTSANRSDRQNKYYWSQMKRLAEVLPEVERTDVGWHEHLKAQILGIKDIILNGEEIPFSTAWLSVQQFNWYLRQANDYILRGWGIEFEYAIIYKYEEWKNKENAR